MSNILIPQLSSLDPLAPREVQADAPHMANHELSLSRQTSALWYRTSGTSMHWLWPDPRDAPTAEFLSGTLSPSFQLSGQQVQLPWYFHPNAARIEAVVDVAVRGDSSFKVRLETIAMADAISAKTGAYSEAIQLGGASAIPRSPWLLRKGDLGYDSIKRVKLSIIPSPPSSRRFALTLTALWDGVWASNVSGAEETSVEACIYAIYAREVLRGPV